jgi:trehalose/maltose transport system permease protein
MEKPEMPQDRKRTVLLWAGVAFLVCFCLPPFVYMLITALSTDAQEFLSPGGSFIATLAHFQTVLFSPALHFPRYLWNSVGIAAISAVLAVAVSAAAAYALTRIEVPGAQAVMLGVLALSMFPPVSLVSYLFRFMTSLGLIDTWPALILPYMAWNVPLSLWILVSYFQQIPRDLDRAALVDGASRWAVLTRILLPVAAPGVLSTMLLAFIFAFNEFLFALMLTTDSAARTIPVGIALFEGLHGQIPWGEIMAAAAVATAPVVVLTLFFQRWIIQGLTRGAVKG